MNINRNININRNRRKRNSIVLEKSSNKKISTYDIIYIIYIKNEDIYLIDEAYGRLNEYPLEQSG